MAKQQPENLRYTQHLFKYVWFFVIPCIIWCGWVFANLALQLINHTEYWNTGYTVFMMLCYMLLLDLSLYVAFLLPEMKIEIDEVGIRISLERKHGEMKWEDVRCVGCFYIRGYRLMFFSTVPGIWKVYNMFGNKLPLSILMTVMANKKIDRAVSSCWQGEIVFLKDV